LTSFYIETLSAQQPSTAHNRGMKKKIKPKTFYIFFSPSSIAYTIKHRPTAHSTASTLLYLKKDKNVTLLLFFD
jgi:hypothetical protein